MQKIRFLYCRMSTFTLSDAFLTFGTGVVLPSADVYSDIGLSVDLLNKSCVDYVHKYFNCNNHEGVKTTHTL